jgi:hypothetical protein
LIRILSHRGILRIIVIFLIVIAFHDIVCFSEIDSRFANSKTSLNAALKEVSNILSDKKPNNEESAYSKLGALINQANVDTALALLGFVRQSPKTISK